MIRALVALLVVVGFGSLPVAISAHGTEVSVVGEVRPGGPIEIHGEDFEADDIVRLELRKEGVEPLELARVPVETDGSFAITLHLAATVSPGIYELAADGKESATAEVAVLRAANGEQQPGAEPSQEGSATNERPAGETAGLAAMAGIFALVGVGLIWLSRTRPHRTPA